MKLLFAAIAFVFILTPMPSFADDASLLGPTSSGGSNAASTESLNSLQPTSGSTLQPTGSTPASQSTDQSSLQQTATDQSKLLVQGDADHSPEATSDSTSSIWYGLAIAATLILVTLIVILLARYDLQPEPASKKPLRPVASKTAKKKRKKR